MCIQAHGCTTAPRCMTKEGTCLYPLGAAALHYEGVRDLGRCHVHKGSLLLTFA